jgi:hypothetical protein
MSFARSSWDVMGRGALRAVSHRAKVLTARASRDRGVALWGGDGVATGWRAATAASGTRVPLERKTCSGRGDGEPPAGAAGARCAWMAARCASAWRRGWGTRARATRGRSAPTCYRSLCSCATERGATTTTRRWAEGLGRGVPAARSRRGASCQRGSVAGRVDGRVSGTLRRPRRRRPDMRRARRELPRGEVGASGGATRWGEWRLRSPGRTGSRGCCCGSRACCCCATRRAGWPRRCSTTHRGSRGCRCRRLPRCRRAPTARGASPCATPVTGRDRVDALRSGSLFGP